MVGLQHSLDRYSRTICRDRKRIDGLDCFLTLTTWCNWVMVLIKLTISQSTSRISDILCILRFTQSNPSISPWETRNLWKLSDILTAYNYFVVDLKSSSEYSCSVFFLPPELRNYFTKIFPLPRVSKPPGLVCSNTLVALVCVLFKWRICSDNVTLSWTPDILSSSTDILFPWYLHFKFDTTLTLPSPSNG